MRSTKGTNRPTVFAFLVAVATAAGADIGAAQTAASPWTAWLGCWEAVAPSVETAVAAPIAPEAGTLCVLPVDGDAAEFMMVDEGGEQRLRVSADGQRVAVERDGCSGWESVAASPDGKRIYRLSEFDCGGQLPRRTSSILGFVGSGEWVDVEGVSVGDFTDIRVARYRRATATPEAELALEGRTLQIDAARTAASARIGLSDVIEASQQVEAAVVEGWLIERNQGFELDAVRLRELASAQVPDRVIDLMVALSYPAVFAIDRSAREGEVVREEPVVLASDDMPRPLSPTIINRWYDPYYGYGYGYGYGYDPYYTYGRYSRYGSWYGPPVIIVKEPVTDGRDQSTQRSAPRLVNGRGFSRGDNPAPSNPGTSNAGASSSGASASSGSSGSTQSGASAPTRTAKPRTPE